MNIGCIVMAAGMSSRFGGNKLAQEWQGKSLIRHALEAVPTDRPATHCCFRWPTSRCCGVKAWRS